MSIAPVNPVHIYLDWNGKQQPSNQTDWLNHSSVGSEKGEGDALSRCPDEVRHAIAMFAMWRGLIRYESPVVRAYAHAFVTAGRANTWAMSAVKRQANPPLNRWHIEVLHSRGGLKCMIGRTIHYFGKNMNRLSVHGPNANKTSKERISIDPFAIGRSYDQDDQPNGIVEMAQDTFGILKQRGTMVRVRPKSYENFLHAIQPTMQPYFTDPQYRPLFTRIRKPRSESMSRLVPVSVTVGMDWLTAVLPYAIRESFGFNHRWAHDEIKRYSSAREEYAMQVLANGGDLKDRLELFDKWSEAMYLMPSIDPCRKIMHSMDGREQLGVIEMPGLNGKTMQEMKTATPSIPQDDEE